MKFADSIVDLLWAMCDAHYSLWFSSVSPLLQASQCVSDCLTVTFNGLWWKQTQSADSALRVFPFKWLLERWCHLTPVGPYIMWCGLSHRPPPPLFFFFNRLVLEGEAAREQVSNEVVCVLFACTLVCVRVLQVFPGCFWKPPLQQARLEPSCGGLCSLVMALWHRLFSLHWQNSVYWSFKSQVYWIFGCSVLVTFSEIIFY